MHNGIHRVTEAHSKQNTHREVKARILERMAEWTEMFARDPDLGIMEQAYGKLKSQSRSMAGTIRGTFHANECQILLFMPLRNLTSNKSRIQTSRRKRMNYKWP